MENIIIIETDYGHGEITFNDFLNIPKRPPEDPPLSEYIPIFCKKLSLETNSINLTSF